MTKASRFLALASLVSLPVFALACAPETPNTDDSQAQQDDAALSATTRAFVTLKRDMRKCASPMCGGWFATDVNKTTAAHYVASLDFSGANLDAATEQTVTDAPDGEVVIYGKLGPAGSRGTRDLVVTSAYRGMPDVVPASGDVFYTASTRNIQCFTAPCDDLTARKLNSSAKTNYTRTAIGLGHFVQMDWLTHRVQDDGAIIVGSIANGSHFPGGYEHVLTASQVYLKLPETAGVCPAKPIMQCPAGEVETFTRTPDRCLEPAGCVTAHACTFFLPYCGTNYTSEAWVRSNGCSMVTCDPAWIYPTP